MRRIVNFRKQRETVRPPATSGLYAPRVVWWSLFFLVWTVQVGLYAFASYYRRRGTDTPMSAGDAIQVAAIDWYLWAAICLLCFWIARRLPLEQYRLRLLVPILTVCSFGVTIGRGVIDQGISLVLGWDPITFADRVITSLPGRFILVLMFICVGYAIEYIRLHRERELKAANLRAELATAQLQMLKVQLQPHFLFNTLHAISSLMYIDVDAADRMLVRLSDLLRRTLQTMDAQLVTLAEEISFLEPYVEIERIRLGDRLNVEFDIAPGTNSALVPHLILQPLVENAIRHGIFPKVGGGKLTISSEINGTRLHLNVVDDGVGIRHDGGRAGAGVGLRNTRARLAHLYGMAAGVAIHARPAGGVRASISIPLRLLDSPSEEATAGEPALHPLPLRAEVPAPDRIAPTTA